MTFKLAVMAFEVVAFSIGVFVFSAVATFLTRIRRLYFFDTYSFFLSFIDYELL